MKVWTSRHYYVDRHLSAQENVWIAAARLATVSPLHVPFGLGRVPKRQVRHRQRQQSTIVELQSSRLLSTRMPWNSSPTPATNNENRIVQLCGLDSKISYSGANTKIKVPASRRASPIISSVCFLPGKITSAPRSEPLSYGQAAPLISYSRFSEDRSPRIGPETGMSFYNC